MDGVKTDGGSVYNTLAVRRIPVLATDERNTVPVAFTGTRACFCPRAVCSSSQNPRASYDTYHAPVKRAIYTYVLRSTGESDRRTFISVYPR